MIIFIPNNFIPERKYIIDVLLHEFLGLDYEIRIQPELVDYVIELENGKQLIIEDHFFSNQNENSGYLSEKNIPGEVSFFKTKWIPESDIPILYGTSKLDYDNTGSNTIRCGIDIFASSFFMLSRWEEHVISERDKYDRFPEHLSLSQINGFHLRPVVNEYCELLWNLLIELGYQGERKKQKYNVILTHDVDQVARYDTLLKFFKAMMGDIIYRKNPFLIITTSLDFIKIKLNIKKDNFNTFDWLMDFSDSLKVKSRFYFIPSIKGEVDARYDINDSYVKNTIHNIKSRGHIVGIHGSFESYNESEIFKQEVQRLNDICGKIDEGRQHYLRFENPKTWQIWEDNGFITDSTFGFYNDIGFRSGTCYQYSVFNILSREKLSLKESPMIVMDVPLILQHAEPEKAITAALDISKTIKKYNGNFVFLWHTNNLFHPNWKKYVSVYKGILEGIG